MPQQLVTIVPLHPIPAPPEPTPYDKACVEAGRARVHGFVMHPQTYLSMLERWTTEEQRAHLHWPSVIQSAVTCAEQLADQYRDSGCGFGSSDHTYEMISFLREIGFITAFVRTEEGYEVGRIIGRTAYSVGWKEGIEREALDFFGPGENYEECWQRISVWRQAERAQPDFAEKNPNVQANWGNPSYFYDIQVLFDKTHRYPGFEGVKPGRW